MDSIYSISLFYLIEVPKGHLGVRPAVIEDPMICLAYFSAVLAGLKHFHETLPGWIYGW
ncbi:hypothetical protein ACFY19_27620 [Streptosporangium saharense]|uniref:hypothetical protein n=1 Tax=Streptosporangium saharense TaxID=1706840 RepID=UPI0036952416